VRDSRVHHDHRAALGIIIANHHHAHIMKVSDASTTCDGIGAAIRATTAAEIARRHRHPHQ